MSVSRRGFLKGAATGVAATAALSAGNLAFAQDINDEGCAWAGEELQIDEADIKETIECEALIVGFGTGGCFCGGFMIENGIKPLVIEKLPMCNGVKGDLGAFNSRFVEEHGDHMDPAHIYHQLIDYSAGSGDSRLYKLWMEESPKAIEALDDLLQKRGLGHVYHDGGYAQMNNWSGPLSVGAYTKNPTGHHVQLDVEFPEATGFPSAALAIEKIILEEGGQILYSTAMVKIEHDGFKVTGVIAEDENGDYIRINAEKGVVLATGGYQGNHDLYVQLQPDQACFTPSKELSGSCTGDGHRAALWMGAAVDEIHTSMFFERRALFPGECPPEVESDYKSVNLASHPFLKLNCYGDRFVNESQPYDYILHQIVNYPERVFNQIMDANFAKYMLQFECVGCCRYHKYPSACEDYAAEQGEIEAALQERVQTQLDQLVEEGYCVKADTIEELAEMMGLPVDHVTAAVDRYNELYALGEDQDFYKEPYRLSALDTPPFYGLRFCGRMLCTMDGIRVDPQLRVVNKQGEPFENVYAIGDCSGGMFTHTYPNLFTGLAAGRTMTWGYVVANEIAGK